MGLSGQAICEKEIQNNYDELMGNRNNNIKFYCVTVTEKYDCLTFDSKFVSSVNDNENYDEVMSELLEGHYDCEVTRGLERLEVIFSNGIRASLKAKECTEQEASVLIKYL